MILVVERCDPKTGAVTSTGKLVLEPNTALLACDLRNLEAVSKALRDLAGQLK